MARKSTPTGKQTREKIVAAALDCYQDRGAAGVTITEIARRAKIPSPLVHYYFPEAGGVLLAAVEDVLARVRAYVADRVEKAADNPTEGILAYIGAHYRWARENPGLFSLFIYLHYEASRSPAYTALNTQIRESARRRLAAFLYEGVVRGEFRALKDPEIKKLVIEIQILATGGWLVPFTETDCDAVQTEKLVLSRVLQLIKKV